MQIADVQPQWSYNEGATFDVSCDQKRLAYFCFVTRTLYIHSKRTVELYIVVSEVLFEYWGLPSSLQKSLYSQ